jgi:biopolymer transport protein ExbD
MPIILLADETVPTGVLVDVIDECKLGGGKKISIAAQRE